jgi:type IV secretory pathway TraG/TraD family ATPase VirD4
MLFVKHALARFDFPQAERERRNLLMLVADECQQFVTLSEHGMSDHNVVDLIREAKVAMIAATQSTTSLTPVLGNDAARVYTLNLRHRLIFQSADEADAKASAEFIGRRMRRKRTATQAKGGRSVSSNEVKDYRIKPTELLGLRKHECVFVHGEHGHRKRQIPPMESYGTRLTWFQR